MIYLLLGVGRVWANRGLDGREIPGITGLSDQVLLSECRERLFDLLGGHATKGAGAFVDLADGAGLTGFAFDELEDEECIAFE